jgi:SSS family solute:Na+ symporter
LQFPEKEAEMYILGMHSLDALLIIVYFIGILWIAFRISRRITGTKEYFLAGRRMGRFYQFFLNFGASTDASQAAAVSREIYRQGIAGMWIQYIVLFLTPFYWFTALLFRRVRLTTTGDFFEERFNSKFLGSAFAVFSIVLALISGAMGYLVSAKTFMALTPKAPAEYTIEEKRSVEQYQEYHELHKDYLAGTLDPAQEPRYEALKSLNNQGSLNAFISNTDPTIFYLIYATCVCLYVLLGGFEAAAVTDALQGILMIFFSLLLVPFGLYAIGGFSGLHEKVPEHNFWLFGTEALSEYAWYTIAAMALANLVSIAAVSHNMQAVGSARDENTARFGNIGGMMLKRVMMIFWALAGLIAIGLYAGELSDPDLAWGHMTNNLLSPGFIGIMMIGVLAASMSTLDATAMAISALVVNQLYKPLFPDKSEAHYIKVGRLAVVFVIYGGVLMALAVFNLLELFKYAITAPAIFGAAIWLGFLWRRLTKAAVIVQIFASILVIAVIPNLFERWDFTRSSKSLLRQTNELRLTVTTKALQEDVEAGRAQRIGESITKHRVIPAYSIFFDRIARENPEDPNSRLLGYGRFNAELWILSWLGFDFSSLAKAQLVALRFLFDAIFPFILLFAVSYFTRPNRKENLDYFYAKIHTPVQKTPEDDERVIAENAKNMARFGSSILLPKTQWEIHKPGKMDYLGFVGTWGLVGVIIFVLWLVVNIGA